MILEKNAVHEELYELQFKMVLERLSNDEQPYPELPNGGISEEAIEEAGEQFKAALRRQLIKSEDKNSFRLRMSNIGRPSCQLQMEKNPDVVASRRPYNHVVRMLIGDATECIVNAIIPTTKINVTGHNEETQIEIASSTIKGTNDIELDNKVFDVKSASPWAFANKWSKGWQGLMEEDSFGYKAQLLAYSKGRGIDPGGWIVVNKASGEIAVILCEATEEDTKKVWKGVEDTVRKITNEEPFERCFEPYPETFRGKPTGATRLPPVCTFCDYMRSCWPEAVYKPSGESKAKNPPMHWYIDYPEKKEE